MSVISSPGQGTAPASARRTAPVQSVARAVALLRAVTTSDPGGSTVGALAAACGLNRATAWRLLTTLEAEGLVVSDRSTGRWAPGLGLADLADPSGDRSLEALLRAAAPVLERVSREAGETAALAVWRGGELTYVAEVAPSAVVAASWRGRSVAVHATSTGKALLAFSPAHEADALLARLDLERHTDTTVTDRTVLVAELERTRVRGYGVCEGEFERAAYGVSAPVLGRSGRVLALLSIWGPGDRLTPARFPHLGPLAVRGAAEISGLSGVSGV